MSLGAFFVWLSVVLSSGNPGAPRPPGDVPIVDVSVGEIGTHGPGSYTITVTLPIDH